VSIPRLVALAVFLAAASLAPAVAGEIAPGCDADLAAVDASFDETMTRLQAAGSADQAEKCAALHHHIDVMTKAGEVFQRCLAEGHDKGENLGQVYGTIADFQDILVEQGCQ
jgi:hypothetical protein